jgi:hypothetical protein
MGKKKLTAVAAALVVLIVAISGTFAWISFNNKNTTGITGQDETPGGSTHDDFADPNKDVYVENWGDVPIYVRVKISEYMEVGKLAGTTDANKDVVKLKPDSEFEDESTWYPYNVAAVDTPFRQYWTLVGGGQKYYKPVAAENQVAGYVAKDPTPYNGSEAGVKLTLPAQVLDMKTWVLSGMTIGEYWVGDTDGWFYWAAPLEPGQATGLLLDRIDKAQKVPGGTYYYGIHTDTQMATRTGDLSAPEDYTSFGTSELGGWTFDGAALMKRITGNDYAYSPVDDPAQTPETPEESKDADSDVKEDSEDADTDVKEDSEGADTEEDSEGADVEEDSEGADTEEDSEDADTEEDSAADPDVPGAVEPDAEDSDSEDSDAGTDDLTTETDVEIVDKPIEIVDKPIKIVD